jgi:dinuclear metal center YbgI/SA1388 family protein
MPTVAAVAEILESFAPPPLAADWDNVGLLLGERTAEVRRIVTCLTVTAEVAAEAVAEQAQLVVTHHPILFRAVKRLTDATPEGRMLLLLIRHGVAVYSPHTAFDNTRGGINDMLAAMLGLSDVTPLRRREQGVGHAA